MKKYLPLLERHVQWIAIALGAIYLLWSISSYVASDPVQTSVAGKTVGLGTVDQTVLQSAARPLQEAMNSSQPVPGLNRRPQFVHKFVSRMNEAGADHAKLVMAEGWLDAPTASGVNINIAAPGKFKGPVKSLPTPPAPSMVGVLAGRSEVVSPVGNTNNTNGQPATEDKNWVTVEGKISIKPLAAALDAAKIPQANQMIEFLRVQLQRQELLANGTWGNQTIINPPDYLGIPAYPTGNNPASEISYADFAKKSPERILQPPFYQISKGDPWYIPSDTATAQALANPNGPVFDPTNLKMIPKTDAQKRARREYLNSPEFKEKRQQQHQQQRTQPGGPNMAPMGPAGPGMGGGGGGGGGYGPAGRANPPADQRAQLAQYNAPPGYGRMGPAGPGMYGPGGPGGPGMYGPGMGPGFEGPTPSPLNQTNSSAAIQAAHQNLPQGQFDPSKQPEVECWAFDLTAMPGTTYRYRLAYIVSNPVHGDHNLAGSQQVLEQFGMTSQFSDWSSSVTVSATTSFFVASGISSSDKINMRIYKWQNGVTSAVTEWDSPGDIVGADHASDNGIDYQTKWTVVEIHPSREGRSYVLLTNDQGHMVKRDFKSDELSAENRKLKQEVDAAKAAAKAQQQNSANTPGGVNDAPMLR